MSGETTGSFGPGNGLDNGAQPVSDRPVLQWRSAKCGTHGACVEIADLPDGGTAIRDGKTGDASPVLAFTEAEWAAFAAAIRTGELG